MVKSVMVFTPVYKLDPRTVDAIMALEWDGPLTFVFQRDNPKPTPEGATERERHAVGVANHLHQYQKGRETFLRGDYDALLVIEDDMIPPPDALKRLAAVMAKNRSCKVVHGVYEYRHGVKVVNILKRYYPWPKQARNPGESLSTQPGQLKDAQRKGVIDCSGSGLGCILIDREVVERIPFDEHPRDKECYFDFPWTMAVYQHPYRMMADMSVECGHIDESGEVLMPKVY